MHAVKQIIKKSIKKFISLMSAMLPEKTLRLVTKTLLFAINEITHVTMNMSAKKHDGEIFIAIMLEGGMGDSLIALAWIKEFYKQCGCRVAIDVFGRAELPALCFMRGYIRNIFLHAMYDTIEGYHIKINIGHFIYIYEIHEKFLSNAAPELLTLLNRLLTFQNRHVKYSIIRLASFCTLNGRNCGDKPRLREAEDFPGLASYDGAWASFCTLNGWNRWDELGASGAIAFSRNNNASVQLSLDAFQSIKKYDLAGKRYVTLHNGSGEDNSNFNRNVKIWPEDHWEAFCRLFKEIYPDILLVQLGTSFAQPISGVDISLLGKTSFHESMVILKYALLHIDGESGLVHLRHELGGQSIVLFGPTPVDYFAYAQNINLVSTFCNNCMWMTDDWMRMCPRGFDEAKCMRAITPKTVLQAACNAIDGQHAYKYSAGNFELYSSAQLARDQDIIRDICTQCGLEKQPVSEHIYGPLRMYIHSSKQWEYPYVLRMINAGDGETLKIADVGCGRGILGWYLASKGHDVTVYDIDFQWDNGEDLELEQEYFRFAKEHGFTAEFGSIFNIPAASNSFDIVTCVSVVEHITSKEYALQEMLRVLKPGGKLILTYALVPEGIIINDNLRVQCFTPDSITTILIYFCNKQQYISHVNIRSSFNDVINDKLPYTDITFGGLVIIKNI